MAPRKMPTDVWDGLLRERVGEPLRPERLRSLLVIVPEASGDVALATTVVRHVHRLNPECQVTFATRPTNVPIARMCPGVQHILELAPQSRRSDERSPDSMSRKRYLDEYAGHADAVVYPCPFSEDLDLLNDYGMNCLEAIWLLAGLSEGPAATAPRVWLETPLASDLAPAIIRRALGPAARTRLAVRGVRRFPESLAAIARTGSIKGSGIRVVASDLSGLRNASEIMNPVHRGRLEETPLGRGFVILSTDAYSLPPPPPGVVPALVEALRADGRTVLHNVRDPLRAAAGTVPLVCTYEEFLCLRSAGIPFVGWRSGLCDVAAASQAPLCVLCPPKHEWRRDIPQTYGLRAMGIAPECLEVVCADARDLNDVKIVAHLQGNRL